MQAITIQNDQAEQQVLISRATRRQHGTNVSHSVVAVIERNVQSFNCSKKMFSAHFNLIYENQLIHHFHVS